MAASDTGKKRKAVTRDVDGEPAVVSGDEFEFGQLDGEFSDSDLSHDDGAAGDSDELESDESGELEDSDSLGSDEIPSDGESRQKHAPLRNKADEVDINVDLVEPLEEEDESEGEKLKYTIVKDANGNDRYIYNEIDPDDDSEYSAGDAEQNTVGDIPLSFYDSYPHIGYNINGKKIMRPATGEALDALIDSMEVPKGWTGLTDPSTGKPLELSQHELQLLRKIQMNEVPADGYDPYEPTIEYFTSKLEIMPLNAAPEPKRRFVPSKHEAKRVMKIVRAIREGRILPYKPPQTDQEDDVEFQNYDIWANEQPRADHAMHMPAPKLPPPGFDESYHPPPEYLPDRKEKKAWEDTDPEDREKDYLPEDHDSLRKVPGYDRFVQEKFERCLDLYLAPRVRRSKLNIDPESLLPKLPSPDELKPFPSACATIFRGHTGRVRSLAIDPSGSYLASGGDDGTVRVWSLLSGRQIWLATLDSENAVNVVRWRPGKDAFILAACCGESIYFAVPRNCSPEITPEYEAASHDVLEAGFGHAADSSNTKSKTSLQWIRTPPSLVDQSVPLAIPLGPSHTPRSLSFHRHGAYIVSVCPSPSTPASTAISIHHLPNHSTQHPFKKRLRGGGPPQHAHFHPSRPYLFVSNQRLIRLYDLQSQTLLKIILPGARWISDFAVHPTASQMSGSDHLVVGSYDKRLLWIDVALSPRPYKTLRYHSKAIRTVRFHPNAAALPLFADASDDADIQIFHGSVSADGLQDARIVPLKVLRGGAASGGHTVKGGLGVLDLDWHPTQPWLVSAGGDGTCRLWT